ncbi:hypothetical protein BC835DRAFT_1304515 [Cytidiella melzeri]|nr:hypothetical protein BC835DRAFT_1304515 [Cytidiella melzeri]
MSAHSSDSDLTKVKVPEQILNAITHHGQLEVVTPQRSRSCTTTASSGGNPTEPLGGKSFVMRESRLWTGSASKDLDAFRMTIIYRFKEPAFPGNRHSMGMQAVGLISSGRTTMPRLRMLYTQRAKAVSAVSRYSLGRHDDLHPYNLFTDLTMLSPPHTYPISPMQLPSVVRASSKRAAEDEDNRLFHRQRPTPLF